MPCRRRPNTCSRASGDLVQAPGQSVQGLLRVLLAPYGSDGAEQLILEGDDAPLGPAAAVALALIVHENATNAVKYGALAAPLGRVTIRCTRNNDMLEVMWEERGGPPAPEAPGQRGFRNRNDHPQRLGTARRHDRIRMVRGGFDDPRERAPGEPRPLNRGPPAEAALFLGFLA